MPIDYQESVTGVGADDLAGFFDGWPQPPSAESRLALLRGSSEVIVARESESGAVVGFITAVGDGVLCAYIPLLEVLAAYRGQGIGSELVRRMLARLEPLYMIDLLCDRELQGFYRRLGFSEATGMMRRDRAAL
jgi:ribosomal protein S18 acetylase RimI-like enzyme